MDFSSLSANDLARTCGHAGSNEAWNEFVRRFQRPIALAVMRTARNWGVTSGAAIDDLVQETFLRLCVDECRLLKNFVAREPDSVIGYLKVIAANVTHDHMRGEKSQKRGGNVERCEHADERMQESQFVPRGTPSAERNFVLHEMDRALRGLIPRLITERDRLIFWLYYQQGLSAREIGAIKTLGLTIKGVESSLHRTGEHVRSVLAPTPSQKVFPGSQRSTEEKE
jgi:RNA polymerase sigma-70 factor (ECF subfamily)